MYGPDNWAMVEKIKEARSTHPCLALWPSSKNKLHFLLRSALKVMLLRNWQAHMFLCFDRRALSSWWIILHVCVLGLSLWQQCGFFFWVIELIFSQFSSCLKTQSACLHLPLCFWKSRKYLSTMIVLYSNCQRCYHPVCFVRISRIVVLTTVLVPISPLVFVHSTHSCVRVVLLHFDCRGRYRVGHILKSASFGVFMSFKHTDCSLAPLHFKYFLKNLKFKLAIYSTMEVACYYSSAVLTFLISLSSIL